MAIPAACPGSGAPRALAGMPCADHRVSCCAPHLCAKQRDTALDGLSHALEGCADGNVRSLSALRTASRIRASLNGTEDFTDINVSQTGISITHFMARALGAYYAIPHGMASAMLVPYILEFKKPAAAGNDTIIARAMGVYAAGMDQNKAAEAAKEAVYQLAATAGAPRQLRELSVKQQDLPALAQAAPRRLGP
jgi:lactaldehyde reductase